MEKKLTKKKPAEMTSALKKKRRIRMLLILTAALLVLAITATVLALTLGAGRAVMRTGGIRVKEDLYAYWLSYAKYRYLGERGGRDTRSWWASDSGDGRTHEQACRAYAETYMAQIITAASLFESLGGSLTEGERQALNARYKEMLRYEVSTKKAYNRRAEKLGFEYATLRKVLLYGKEAELLRSLLAVTDDDIYSYYCEQYRHALIIEVRTRDRYVINEEGDLEQDRETGEYIRVELTEAERADVAARIAGIRESLTADGSLNNFLTFYRERGLNEDINILQGRYEDGYFFAPSAEFTGEFAQGLPSGADDIVGGILSQERGSWKEYNAGGSTLFVYVTLGTGDGVRPYEDEANGDFFHDIGSDAADWLCTVKVAEKARAVKVNRKIADRYDIVSMKTDYMLYAD